MVDAGDAADLDPAEEDPLQDSSPVPFTGQFERVSSLAALLDNNEKLGGVGKKHQDWDWGDFENDRKGWILWHLADGGGSVADSPWWFRGNDALAEAREKAAEQKIWKAALPRGALAPGTTFEFGSSHAFDPVTGLGHGFLACLSTQGGQGPFINPIYRGTVRLNTGPDVWMGTNSSILTNRHEISRSRGCENSWFSIEFAMAILPTQYSLRHGWSTADGALKTWELLGSVDGKTWYPYCKHVNDPSLATGPYASATWDIPQMTKKGAPIKPSRFFKVLMKGPHWGGRYFMYCCGFEVYGTVVSVSDVDTSSWGFNME